MVRRLNARVLAAVMLSVLPQSAAGQSTRPAETKAAAPWTPIEATTYEQRQATLLADKPAGQELLVLPFGPFAKQLEPRFVATGEAIAPFPEPWRYVDRLLSKIPLHEEYLKQRTALAANGLALVEWCVKNRLDECALFEASRRMSEIGDFQKPEYAPYLRRWLKIRDRRRLDMSFPLPFDGEWYVLKDESGHHRKKSFAAYAFDLVQKVGTKMSRGDGTKVEDYFDFGKPILAQADGVVVSVDDGFPDNTPGKVASFDDANSVVVDYGGGIVALYAHCRRGSGAVKPEQRVVRGTKLAEVGNSGASSIPHLHLTMMDWGYESVRGRFHGEVRRSSSWSTFEGRDLEPGTFVRNRVAESRPAGGRAR